MKKEEEEDLGHFGSSPLAAIAAPTTTSTTLDEEEEDKLGQSSTSPQAAVAVTAAPTHFPSSPRSPCSPVSLPIDIHVVDEVGR